MNAKNATRNAAMQKDDSFAAEIRRAFPACPPRSENSPFFDPRAKDVFAGFSSAQDAAVLRFLRDVLLPAWPECVPVVSAIVFWEYRTTHPATA